MNFNFHIAIVAPCPCIKETKEGWMSRISAIDSILSKYKRLYINFSDFHDEEIPKIHNHSELVSEIYLSPKNNKHFEILNTITNYINYIYVHTIHLSEFILPVIQNTNFIVDFHGIVPEEEAMLGHPGRILKYELIEKTVLKSCPLIIMVSNAMTEFYKKKYTEIKFESKVIVLPIVENPEDFESNEKKDYNEKKVEVIYSGGSQIWQNLEQMLMLSICSKKYANFTFLSHDWMAIQSRAKQIKCPQKNRYLFSTKRELKGNYLKSDYGLVIRDDTPVNIVSSPTKLYEYLFYGVLPIVKLVDIGDFNELGFSYISDEEFKDGFYPDKLTYYNLIYNNKEVAKRMRERYLVSSSKLLDFLNT